MRGPTAWGKKNSTPGISGSQGNLEWLGDSVGSLRGLGRIRGLVAWLMVATFLSPVGACPSAAFLPTAYAVGCALSPLRGYSLSCFRGYFVAALRVFSGLLRGCCVSPLRGLFCIAASAGIHGRLEPQSGARMQPTALAVGKKQKPTSPSRGERS